MCKEVVSSPGSASRRRRGSAECSLPDLNDRELPVVAAECSEPAADQQGPDDDIVTEADLESFPASDAPPWWPGRERATSTMGQTSPDDGSVSSSAERDDGP